MGFPFSKFKGFRVLFCLAVTFVRDSKFPVAYLYFNKLLPFSSVFYDPSSIIYPKFITFIDGDGIFFRECIVFGMR